MQKKYKHIFFDLDNTLWDFKANCQDTFEEIFQKHKLYTKFPSVEVFLNHYEKHNEHLWGLYRTGAISKDKLRLERFRLTLEDFGIRDQHLAKIIGDEYLATCPVKTRLFPHTREMLDYLSNQYYLHIITNGFEKTQRMKLESCSLSPYFSSVITSETIHVQKPKPGIFAHALKQMNARKTESIMVGDDLEVDILGAKKFGIDQVFFNHGKVSHQFNVTHEIHSLQELKTIF